jgi:hypothetical protein
VSGRYAGGHQKHQHSVLQLPLLFTLE